MFNCSPTLCLPSGKGSSATPVSDRSHIFCKKKLQQPCCLPQVELQGVSLVVLSFFRNEEKAVQLANLVKSAGGILGAAVCCAENGGDPNDDWTTCDRDRDVLLDRYAQMVEWSVHEYI